jgi:hypothetical protein
VELAARMIADTMETSSGRKIVVEKSTVPVRAAESIANILRYTHSQWWGSGFRIRRIRMCFGLPDPDPDPSLFS